MHPCEHAIRSYSQTPAPAATGQTKNTAAGAASGRPTSRLQTAVSRSQPTVVDIGDVIGDPNADVVVGHADGTITLLEGQPDGSLLLRNDLNIDAQLGSVRGLEVFDFDGDGHLELVAIGDSGAKLLRPAADPLPQTPIRNGDF